MELRPYQIDIAQRAADRLRQLNIVYISAEVRTGKTLMALETAKLIGAKSVLFLTKKKAIGSIQSDYSKAGYSYNLTVINNESIHLVNGQFDLIISDEHHRCFLGNTLVGNVKIKDIKIGSFQKSFNFVKGEYENKKVLNVFKNPLKENLVKIKCNGKEIICTESHEIFTKRGWVKAKNILSSDELQVV